MNIEKFNIEYKEIIKTHKPCSICNNFKPFTDYDYTDNKTKRLRGDCKNCRKIRNAKQYLKRKNS